MALITPAIDLNKKALIDAYVQAIADLQTIQNTANPTNAQVIWGVKKIAEIHEKMLKFIKSQIV